MRFSSAASYVLAVQASILSFFDSNHSFAYSLTRIRFIDGAGFLATSTSAARCCAASCSETPSRSFSTSFFLPVRRSVAFARTQYVDPSTRYTPGYLVAVPLFLIMRFQSVSRRTSIGSTSVTRDGGARFSQRARREPKRQCSIERLGAPTEICRGSKSTSGYRRFRVPRCWLVFAGSAGGAATNFA